MLSTCLLIAAFYSAVEGATAVSAHSELDVREIPFHHVAHLRVTVEGDAETDIAVESWHETLPGLSVDARDPTVTLLPNGRKQIVREFVLSPSFARRYTLSAPRVLANGVEVTVLEPMDLEVRALTPEEKSKASVQAELITLADMESPGPPRWFASLLAIASLATTILVIGFCLWRLRRRAGTRAIASPLEAAEAALAALQMKLSTSHIEGEAFFVALSGILRDYLCASFDPSVAGQSTPEFFAITLSVLPIPASQSDAVRLLYQHMDRVKYGQGYADEAAQERALIAVRNFIALLEKQVTVEAEEALRRAV